MKSEQKRKVVSNVLKHLTNVLLAGALALFVFVVLNF